jgi:Uma2 family endonuclease
VQQSQEWTVERALRELPPEARWEIDEGRLELREPPGPYHGDAVARVTVRLFAHVEARQPGRVLAGDPGFHLARNPDTLRAPDVAVVGVERLAKIADPDGFSPVAPDVAVEVLSPNDRRGAVRRKVAQYLASGVRSVWVLDPRARTLELHLESGDVRVFEGDAAVVEDPALPGFLCALGDLLPPPWPSSVP